jgi:hypothetical protein
VTTAAIAPEPGPEPPPAPDQRRGLRAELLLTVGVAVVVAALGLPLGLLWRAVAPQVEFAVIDGGPVPVQQEPEGFVADDGTYILLTVGMGILVAIVVWLLLRRRRGPVLLVGLILGSIAGGVLTLWLGRHIGYAHYRDLVAHAPVGTHFRRPPDVRSARIGLWFGFLPKVQGAALLQAVAATTTYMMLASFHVEPDLRRPDPRDPSSVPPEWTVQPAWPAPHGSDPAAPPRD